VSLNQLEPSGPVPASTGNALPLPSNNGESVITFKLKAKENIFTQPSFCYFILHKNMTLTKVECFSQICIFQTLKTATSSALTSKFAICHVIVTDSRIFSRCGGDVQWDNIHTMNI
jgi:hypothetical protein